MIEVGKIYELKKANRWGGKFKVHKVTEWGVVCGRYMGSVWGSQGACIKIEEFREMIKE